MKIYTNNKGKRVLAGEVIGKTFFKKVDPKKHMLRIPPSYAIQLDVYMQLQGLERICIIEPKRRLFSTLIDWRKHSITVDRGHGSQIALMIKYMSDDTQPKLL